MKLNVALVTVAMAGATLTLAAPMPGEVLEKLGSKVSEEGSAEAALAPDALEASDHETWLLLGDLRSRVDWRKDLVYRQGEAVSEAKHKLGKLERSHGRQHAWWETMYEKYFGDGDLRWAHRSWKHESNHLQKTKADLSRTRKFQTLVREARSKSIKTKIPVPIEALKKKKEKLRI